MPITCQDPRVLVAALNIGARQRHPRAKTTLFARPRTGWGPRLRKKRHQATFCPSKKAGKA